MVFLLCQAQLRRYVCCIFAYAVGCLWYALLGLTLSIDNTWPLLVSDHAGMFINAGVIIKVYVFDIKGKYQQFESCHE